MKQLACFVCLLRGPTYGACVECFTNVSNTLSACFCWIPVDMSWCMMSSSSKDHYKNDSPRGKKKQEISIFFFTHVPPSHAIGSSAAVYGERVALEPSPALPSHVPAPDSSAAVYGESALRDILKRVAGHRFQHLR